jgi:metallo-beta-lactamase family protein
MQPTLTFHGAAGCVTGFCARLVTEHAQILIDCGMFQGPKTLKALNYDPFPFDVREIDAVLLTHAHIDHSGLLPKLMRAGFDGPIYATAGTRDLCGVMLPDAGHIQESEVRQLNRRNQRRGRAEVSPIYTARDGVRCLELFRKIKLGDEVEIARGLKARWWNAGHILGSASIEVVVEGDEGPIRLLFSGDLGPGGRDYAADPESPSGIDHLIIESTYGDRERDDPEPQARRAMLADELREARGAGGPLLIPAFAVERTQELLADLLQVMDEDPALGGEIFLDSPLAIEATDVFLRRGWNPEAGRNPFESLLGSQRLRLLKKPQESDRLDRLKGWHVILAASGMCDAGRVRKHLKRLLWRREATVMLAGFQAKGTLGRLLHDGEKNIRIQGEDIVVRARIRSLDVYSGHADARGLVAWAEARRPVSGAVFIAHGEPQASQALRDRLAAAGFDAARLMTPKMDESFALSRAAVQPLEGGRARIAADAPARPDWHNVRAAFLGALNARLEAAPDDAARQRLLAEMVEQLQRNDQHDPSQGGPDKSRLAVA